MSRQHINWPESTRDKFWRLLRLINVTFIITLQNVMLFIFGVVMFVRNLISHLILGIVFISLIDLCPRVELLIEDWIVLRCSMSLILAAMT